MIDLPLLVRPTVVVGSCRNVVVACSHNSVTLEDIRALNQRSAQVREFNGGGPLYALLIIGSAARPPSAEVRGELSQATHNSPDATAVVLAQSAIPVALVRSVMATVQFLSSKSMKVDAFREPELGYNWLAQRASIDKTSLPRWDELSLVIERVRNTVPR
jgi:hypothetical protein